MAKITICDWCKGQFKELVHSITIDWHNSCDGQGDKHSGHYEICSVCREEIKSKLDSLEVVPKKKVIRAANETGNYTGPIKICDHNMEIEDGNPGEFILRCTKCGEKGKA